MAGCKKDFEYGCSAAPLDNQKVIALPGRYIPKRTDKGGQCMHNFRFSVVIEKDEDGYTAFCPELQGCYSQGETYEEVLDNIRDAIRLHVDDHIESGEKIPQAQLINLTTVDVSV
jgi:predicted RNase H-like HicB family nuclease